MSSLEFTGLPWLGQFNYLAPAADFAGSVLYNAAQNISPFPVRETYKMSYKPGGECNFSLPKYTE